MKKRKLFDLDKVAQSSKKLYIVRGLPGSGKSTLANEIVGDGVVLSSDDFFTVGDKYHFDPNYLDEAHSWNKSRAIEHLERGTSPIVIDNTNVEPWEAKPYVEEAQKRGYDVEIKEPDTDWKFEVDQLAEKNTHGVPRNIIEKMVDKWHPNMTVQDVLDSEKPRNI